MGSTCAVEDCGNGWFLKSHPFERLTPAGYRAWFRFLLAATLIMLILESALGVPLQKCRTKDGGRCDIVSFELARTAERSGGIVDSWRSNSVLHYAKWNTWLDYLFMPCYANLAAMAIAGVLCRKMPEMWRRVGRALAWAQWIVLSADATENVALLRQLYVASARPWPEIAFACAAIKFGLLGIGVVYLLVTLVGTRRPA